MNDQQLLTALLEEYKALRTQIVSTVDRQYSLAYWGISGVAIMIGGLANAWEKLRSYPNVVATLILFIVPGVLTAYVILWAHMVATIAKLGRYLFKLEERVARMATPQLIRESFDVTQEDDLESFRLPIGWEHQLWVESGRPHTLLARTALVVRTTIIGVQAGSIIIGGIVLARLANLRFIKLAVHPAVLISLVLWIAVAVALSRYIELSVKEGDTAPPRTLA